MDFIYYQSGVHSAALDQISLQDLLEALVNISFHEINAILEAFVLELFCIFGYLLAIVWFDLIGLQPHPLTRFHIDKEVGSVVVVKIQLFGFIDHVKKNHLVFVVLEVLQGGKKAVRCFRMIQTYR